MTTPNQITPTAPCVRVASPAKINWMLTIENKRPDGFHNIQTIFQALQWGDELTCSPLQEETCRLTCTHPQVPCGPENLISKAWKLLREALPGRVGGVQFHLNKQIPMGAGLGGGSSNAAAALVGLDRLYALGLSEDQLESYAAQLGSDCAFFIRGGTARGTGRGEILTPVMNKLPETDLILVWPGFASPTAQAYAQFTPKDWQDSSCANKAAQAIQTGELNFLRKNMQNAFYDVVFRHDLRYKLLKEQMINLNLVQPSLSGSGSTMFAMSLDLQQARAACRELERAYPVVILTRINSRGVQVLPDR